MTQGMGDDKEEEEIEGSKGEEAKEAPAHIESTKRKAKAQLVTKEKKIAKPSLLLPPLEPTYVHTHKRPRKRLRPHKEAKSRRNREEKYVAQLDLNEEKTE